MASKLLNGRRASDMLPSPPTMKKETTVCSNTVTVTESSATYCLCGCNDDVTSVDSREFDFDSISSAVFREPVKKNKKTVKGPQQCNVDEFLLKKNLRDRLPKGDGKIDDFRRKLEEKKIEILGDKT